MNRSQFILVLAALVLIGGASLVLLQRSRQSWTAREPEAGSEILPHFQPNEVAAIHIQGSSEFNLVRQNGLWCVPERGDYPANYALLRELLIKLRDLKAVQSELVGPSALAALGLGPPGPGPGGGTLLQFKDAHGQVTGALLLGKRHDRPQKDNEPLGFHGFYDGCYVLVPSEPHKVLLIPDPLLNILPAPGAWLKPDFFKVENIRLISLRSPSPAGGWELSRETDSAPWTLANLKPGERLDPTKASLTAEILAFPRFVDALPKSAASIAGLEKPAVVTVLTDQLAYTLKVSPKRPDGHYLLTVGVAGDVPAERVADPGETPETRERLDKAFQQQTRQLREKLAREQALARWIYVVDSWIELVIRDRSQLLADNPAAGNPAAVQAAGR